jgi:sporulation protein YlmC with PRC-barrel domain
MRLKELRGLPVIDPTAARRIGTVSDYQVDPAAGSVAALDITPADGGAGERVLAQRIRRVGSSAVILTPRGGSMPSGPAELNEHWLDASTMAGLEVMGDDGTRIGHLADATFDQDTLTIGAYLLGGGTFLDGLSGRRNRIEPDTVHSCSRQLMIVTSGGAAASEPTEPSEPEDEAEPAAAQETAPIETPVPMKDADTLKDADKLPAPSFEPVPDGHPLSTAGGGNT